MKARPERLSLLQYLLLTAALLAAALAVCGTILCLHARELPIGVVTSLIGAVVFIFIFYQTGKER